MAADMKAVLDTAVDGVGLPRGRRAPGRRGGGGPEVRAAPAGARARRVGAARRRWPARSRRSRRGKVHGLRRHRRARRRARGERRLAARGRSAAAEVLPVAAAHAAGAAPPRTAVSRRSTGACACWSRRRSGRAGHPRPRLDHGRSRRRCWRHGPAATGETYAFDRQGRMISSSRFPQHLRARGADRPRRGRRALRVEIRDPGGD